MAAQVWRKRGRDWLGYGVHSRHEGRGMSQKANFPPALAQRKKYIY